MFVILLQIVAACEMLIPTHVANVYNVERDHEMFHNAAYCIVRISDQ